MKIQIPYMYVTYPGGKSSYAALLRSIPDELPERPPNLNRIYEVNQERGSSIVCHMLSCGKTVFADSRFLVAVMDETKAYLTSEMLDRLFVVEA